MIHLRLRYLREKNNFSQDQVASAIGVDRQQYYRWEKGKNEPHTETIVKFAQLYGVTTDYLLGLEDEDGTRLPQSEFNLAEWELVHAYRIGHLKKLMQIVGDRFPDTEKVADRGGDSEN